MSNSIRLSLKDAGSQRHSFAMRQLESDLWARMDRPDETISVPISRLYAYCQGLPDPALASMLRHRPELRHVHRQMLASAADVTFDIAMAAADQVIPERLAAGCRIRAVPSRSAPDCHYLIVEAPQQSEGAVLTLSVCSADNVCVTTILPPCRRGATQITLAETDERFLMLTDPSTVVFLK